MDSKVGTQFHNEAHERLLKSSKKRELAQNRFLKIITKLNTLKYCRKLNTQKIGQVSKILP